MFTIGPLNHTWNKYRDQQNLFNPIRGAYGVRGAWNPIPLGAVELGPPTRYENICRANLVQNLTTRYGDFHAANYLL